ncbi:Peroxisomal N(1)-acetyl-spermine/spermidine oxidase [Seminavis robusta]|uniref:Peroxisomal N(1)-acetyl-spermine/spermidine oxidase n=1 Tax=Seminavis robusta TaxID=568900 RepID=A0A9N8DI15_9STRA|nr:Peroxisomal N(1)-acetyl-spermine/spermidine oxidase [Seminavis robusta]|eukprot:Sro163_g073220.1 Peroxisomal N(1)-acetyl-spermine/spermidine oxidase (393) ;mRNA; f:51700-52878
MTILIVGAGAAGLTAAYTLLLQNVTDFRILEASNRIGGRLKKLEGFASFPIDLGGEWIHVQPTVLEDISQNDRIMDSIDTIHHVAEHMVWYGPTEGFAPDHSIDYAKIPDYLFQNYTWFDFFNDTISVPAVKESIVFDCPIVTIDYSGTTDGEDPAKAITATCKDGTSFEGSQIIVTAPIQILQDGDIEFIPELPNKYTNAIDSIPFPGGYKIFLKFEQGFYPDIFESALDPINLYFYNEVYGENTTTEHVLGVFVSGEWAEESAQWDDETLLNHVVAMLDEMFDGKASQYLIDGVVQSWDREPFIRGTYSHYDNTWRQMDRLRKPINGVLYFAGEAIPASYAKYDNGYAHGAALSGKETAERILGSGGGSAAMPWSGVFVSIVAFILALWY